MAVYGTSCGYLDQEPFLPPANSSGSKNPRAAQQKTVCVTPSIVSLWDGTAIALAIRFDIFNCQALRKSLRPFLTIEGESPPGSPRCSIIQSRPSCIDHCCLRPIATDNIVLSVVGL